MLVRAALKREDFEHASELQKELAVLREAYQKKESRIAAMREQAKEYMRTALASLEDRCKALEAENAALKLEASAGHASAGGGGEGGGESATGTSSARALPDTAAGPGSVGAAADSAANPASSAESTAIAESRVREEEALAAAAAATAAASAANAELARARKDLEGLRVRLEESERQLRAVRSEVADVRRSESSLSDQLALTTQRLQDTEAERDRQRSVGEMVQRERAVLEATLSDARREIDSLTKRTEAAEEAARGERLRAEAAEAALARERETHASATTQADAAARQLRERVAALEEEVGRVRAREHEAARKLVEVTRQHEVARATDDERKRALLEERERWEHRLEDERRRAATAAEAAERRRLELVQQLAHSREEVTELQARLRDLRRAFETAESEREAAAQQAASTSSRVERLVRLEEEVGALQRDRARAEAEWARQRDELQAAADIHAAEAEEHKRRRLAAKHEVIQLAQQFERERSTNMHVIESLEVRPSELDAVAREEGEKKGAEPTPREGE